MFVLSTVRDHLTSSRSFTSPSGLFHKEQRVKYDRFSESNGEDRLDQDLRGSVRIAPHCFRGFMPIKPTPRAAPSAAKPTCRLPFISFSLFFPAGSRDLTRSSHRNSSINRARPPVPFLVLANQHRETAVNNMKTSA